MDRPLPYVHPAVTLPHVTYPILQTSSYYTYLLSYLLTRLFTYLLTYYLLTPWSRVLLENLIGSHLVKKFPAFYGTRKFITAFTCARHLFLS